MRATVDGRVVQLEQQLEQTQAAVEREKRATRLEQDMGMFVAVCCSVAVRVCCTLCVLQCVASTCVLRARVRCSVSVVQARDAPRARHECLF